MNIHVNSLNNNATSADAMTELFDFMGNKVRVVVMTNETTGAKEPWFVAMDILGILGLSSTGGVLNALDQGQKQTLSRKRCLTSFGPFLFPGSVSRAVLISEVGLYKLVMKSRKPEAAKFQDWIARDVLPAIRKDGLYVRGEEKVLTGEMSLEEMTLKVITGMQDKVARLTKELEQTEARAVHAEEIVEENLELVTVDEWRALSHIYLTQGQKSSFGRKASKLCRERSLGITKQVRDMARDGFIFPVEVNVYPKAILDEVWGAVTYRSLAQ